MQSVLAVHPMLYCNNVHCPRSLSQSMEFYIFVRSVNPAALKYTRMHDKMKGPKIEEV